MSIWFIAPDRTCLIAVNQLSLLPRNGQISPKSSRSSRLTLMLCHVLWLQMSPSSVRVYAGLLSRTLTRFQEEFCVFLLAETVVPEKEQYVSLIKRTANRVYFLEMGRLPRPPAASQPREDSTRRLWSTSHLTSHKTSWMSLFQSSPWPQAELALPLTGTVVQRMVIHADIAHGYRV